MGDTATIEGMGRNNGMKHCTPARNFVVGRIAYFVKAVASWLLLFHLSDDQSRYDPAPPAHAGRRGRASAPPNPQQRPTPIPAAASMSRGSREAPEVRSSTAPLPIRSGPEEDVHSLFLRDEGDDPRYEYEFNYAPHFGGHYSPSYYYDEEGDHRAHDEDEEMYVEEQSQPRFAEPRAYRAGPSEPGPSQAASPSRQFKSNNPFAKMMANQQ
ncbi:hypothetical protein EV361DRAFT_443764 [Lentinula raphanica]|nr:hypothetical protein EV361DRAFT_443764 [Lentinula raphanica]